MAPYPAAESLAVPLAAGARVAPRDREPTGETILRLPFRVLFYPLRLLARGTEAALGVSDFVGVGPFGFPIGSGLLRPTITYSSNAGFAVPVVFSIPARDPRSSQLEVAGAWSTLDHRRLAARWAFDPPGSHFAYGLEGTYTYRPNLEFYGVGNGTSIDDRSIYLDENGRAQATLRYGQSLRQQVRASAGFSAAGSRRGYHDGPAAADLFTEAEAPYLESATELWHGTLEGDFARVDDDREPSLGVHLTAAATRYFPAGDDDIEYWEFRTVARAYVPVGAPRRVFALQAEHWHVNPDDGGESVPFYRLPRSTDLRRFAAFANGRFVDRHLVLGRAEYRWWLHPKVMAIGFAELGEVASDAGRLRIADVHESYGGGLRLTSNPYTSLRVEVATGAEGTEFAVRFGGVF